MAHRITIYGKPECCLCDKAKEIVNRLRDDFALAVEEVDITGDPDLYRKYKELIPVVVVNDSATFTLKISEYRLRQALAGRTAKDG